MIPEVDVARVAVDLLESWAGQSWDVSVNTFFGPFASAEAVSTSLSTAQSIGAATTTGQLRLLSGWDAYWASDEAGLIEAGFFPESIDPDALEDVLTTWLAAHATALHGDERSRRQLGDLLVETRVYGKTHSTPTLLISLEQPSKPSLTRQSD